MDLAAQTFRLRRYGPGWSIGLRQLTAIMVGIGPGEVGDGWGAGKQKSYETGSG